MSGTSFTYNGIRFNNCLTKKFQQEPVYDDSGTDVIHHKYTIRVQGYIHSLEQYGSEGGLSSEFSTSVQTPDGLSGTFVDGAPIAYKEISKRLGAPRRHLSYKHGDNDVLTVDPYGDGRNLTARQIDVDNGPKPKVIDVTHIAAANVYRVEVEVVACVLDCKSEGEEISHKVVSNRWSMADTYDHNFRLTRITQGRLRVVSADLNPHDFRGTVTPILQGGMRRERMSFTSSSDGLILDYIIVDKETTHAAPAPATEWRFNHGITTGDGMVMYSEVSVSLTGDRNVDHHELIKVGMAIIDQRLFITQDEKNQFVEQLSINDMYGSDINGVHLACRVRLNDKVNFKKGVPVGKIIGRPVQAGPHLPNYDKDENRGQGEAATDGPIGNAKALSAFLQAPCSSEHSHNSGVAPTGNGDPVGSGSETQVTYNQSGDSAEEFDSPHISEEHKKYIYTEYKIEAQYQKKSGKTGLPIAGSYASLGSPTSEDTFAVVNLHSGVAKRQLRIQASRVGEWPETPEPESFRDDNGVLYTVDDVSVISRSKGRTPDGAVHYELLTQIDYFLSRSLETSEKILAFQLPWDNSFKTAQYIPPKAFGLSDA